MNYFVYIVECADKSLYTGITTDAVRRLKEHNGEEKGGAKATRMKRPVTLVYTEKHPSRSDASRREYEIKQFSREEKLALIKSASA
jgi:putative endonuclease